MPQRFRRGDPRGCRGLGYIDHRLAERKLSRNAVISEALEALLLSANANVPQTRRSRTRKQLLAATSMALARRLDMYATWGFPFDCSGLNEKTQRHLHQVAATVRQATTGSHSRDDQDTIEQSARIVAQILAGMDQERPGALLPDELLSEVTGDLQPRPMPTSRVIAIYGATTVTIGFAAWILERLGAATAVPVVAGLLPPF
ncbi:hypothetical protein QLQ12_08780 [Actinoplanes sp. NEAU-A12]|uniref:Uncharacterized protein n=1 Tax=Actinoplanes sandaracinus TaxID=3045177 RepID=A0ABT6WG39_9ACTN|nr:hypothetical protein [Actinoplanes sandaracinus]MDI6098695.1 hypothetical protein [Actinoplanes sandaracinus]